MSIPAYKPSALLCLSKEIGDQILVLILMQTGSIDVEQAVSDGLAKPCFLKDACSSRVVNCAQRAS